MGSKLSKKLEEVAAEVMEKRLKELHDEILAYDSWVVLILLMIALFYLGITFILYPHPSYLLSGLGVVYLIWVVFKIIFDE